MDRAEIISRLEKQNKDFTDCLLDKLRRRKFDFATLGELHAAHLDEKLIVRHALPFCITERTFFGEPPAGADFFANIILLHTLALTRIDDYYDGADDDIRVDNLAYALAATQTAARELFADKTFSRNNYQGIAQLLDVTKFTHARMFQDSIERYDERLLQNPRRRRAEYLTSRRSRLFASGYWEVMARASFARRGRAFPRILHRLDDKLRRLRQIVDEFYDVEEDLAAGLVTLPTLYILSESDKADEFRDEIVAFWHGGAAPRVRELMTETGADAWLKNLATAVYRDGVKELRSVRRDAGYRALFDYKIEKLCPRAAV